MAFHPPFIFRSCLNLDYGVTNFFFPLYTRVSKSIIHSNKWSTLYTFKMPTLNEDLSLACMGRERGPFQAIKV